MTILELNEGKAKYPDLRVSRCDDPRHGDSPEDEAVAVVETAYDVYAVCDGCLAAILN